MFARFSSPALVVGTLTVAASCTSTIAQTPQQATSSRILSGPDISVTGGSSAYDGVRLLDGGLITGGAVRSIRRPDAGPPAVYLDGTRMRSIESLRTVLVADVRSMTYLRGASALMRYGTGHEGGAIVDRVGDDGLLSALGGGRTDRNESSSAVEPP